MIVSLDSGTTRVGQDPRESMRDKWELSGMSFVNISVCGKQGKVSLSGFGKTKLGIGYYYKGNGFFRLSPRYLSSKEKYNSIKAMFFRLSLRYLSGKEKYNRISDPCRRLGHFWSVVNQLKLYKWMEMIEYLNLLEWIYIRGSKLKFSLKLSPLIIKLI